MKFSILIANYNNGKYFKDCYESIIAQTYKDWEAIIVDDKSTDNSVEIIKELIKDDHRFFLYENDQNRGCGYTKNRCTQFATGDICGFLDPDDAIMPEAIECHISQHNKYPNTVLVYSRFLFCDEHLIITGENPYAKKTVSNKYFTNLDYAVNHFATFKKSAFSKTSGIDESLRSAVDQDLYIKLSEVGQFFFLDKLLYKYRIHKKGISTSNPKSALWNHLKALFNAEGRRGISLNEVILPYLNGSEAALIKSEYEKKLNNNRFLIRRIFQNFRKSLFPR